MTMSRELQSFKDALLVRNVIARHLAADEHEAMEFNTPEALQKYLEKHPKADKSRHTVKKTEPDAANDNADTGPSDEAYQKSDAYKTKKDQDYYPQKAPPGLPEPEDVKQILSQFSDEQKSWMNSLPDEDLDKNEAYEHPKLKKVMKHLMQQVLKGHVQASELNDEMEKIQVLKDQLSHKMRNSKSDAEADQYRFPLRKLYKLWQCYNDTWQKASRPELKSGPWSKGGPKPKAPAPAAPNVAPAPLPPHMIDKEVDSEAYHKAPEYKTKRNRSYYPQKAPPGWKMPEDAEKKLNDTQKKQLESMPEEDLEKDESYDHPAVKQVTKDIVDKIKKDPSSRPALSKEMQDLERLKFEIGDKYAEAKNDEEADKYRFARRKINQLWRGYNMAFGELNSAKTAARVLARSMQ